ncbi:MAG: RIP metalloprotease RseP [Bacteroidota bacterium]|nr:RIP metalloprotease RseP [Bacteroidota bacterium]
MEILIKISQFILSFSLLIILHELGHFIPAKLFKTKVEKFYLFFDVKFSLFKKKIGETVYGIGWLPLGGYVKIAGMVDESMDTEQLKKDPEPWEFRSKPAWQRLIIMLGGVTVNFILAFVIYIGIAFVYGELDIKNESLKDGIWVNNPILEEAGLKTGDKIVTVDGKSVDSFFELPEKILLSNQIVVNRNGQELVVNTPKDMIGQVVDNQSRNIVGLRIPCVVTAVSEESKNFDALKPKDIIKSINNTPIDYVDQLPQVLENAKNQTVNATVLRDNKEVNIELNINQEGKIGIAYASMIGLSDLEKINLYPVVRKNPSFMEAIPIGINKGFERLGSYWNQLKKIANPSTGAYKGVGGFKSIYDIFPQTWSWEVFWNITAILSIMLGVMNLLPIPALDGGHVMFLMFEIITGRKPSEKFLEKAQMIGFFILIALLLFANGNDLIKAFTK